LILPKSVSRLLGARIDGLNEESESDKLTFILIATSKGLILRPLQDYLGDDDMRISNTSQNYAPDVIIR
jgi:hypothetical protein